MQTLVGKQERNLEHFHCLDDALAGVVGQYNINPLRLKINTPCSLTLDCAEKKREKEISDVVQMLEKNKKKSG